MTQRVALIAVVAAVAALVPTALFAAGVVSAPGAPGGINNAAQEGYGVSLDESVTVEGRTLELTAVLADAVQTTVSYRWSGNATDGPFITIAPRPRLILPDGTLIPFVGNFQDPAGDGAGTLVFAPLPRGSHDVRLEVDGAQFGDQTVDARFAVSATIDTETGYEESIVKDVILEAGSGASHLRISRVSRTPSLVVVQGEFLGLTVERIQTAGRPNMALVTRDGEVIATDSGRFGFGDDYRQFEIRFPSVRLDQLEGLRLTFDGFAGVEASEGTLTIELPFN